MSLSLSLLLPLRIIPAKGLKRTRRTFQLGSKNVDFLPPWEYFCSTSLHSGDHERFWRFWRYPQRIWRVPAIILESTSSVFPGVFSRWSPQCYASRLDVRGYLQRVFGVYVAGFRVMTVKTSGVAIIFRKSLQESHVRFEASKYFSRRWWERAFGNVGMKSADERPRTFFMSTVHRRSGEPF